MEVLWSEFAAETLREIHVFYKDAVGKSTADRIKSAIFLATKQLARYPESGQIEENLKILGEDHRYLIQGNYKIIYKPVKEGVLVTDIFDTRQDPKKMNISSRRTAR
jgi:plasmid stabilization system protein ParE